MRVVLCPKACGTPGIQAFRMGEHLNSSCPSLYREPICPPCEPAGAPQIRMVPCPWGCGAEIEPSELPLCPAHTAVCPNGTKPCGNGCGVVFTQPFTAQDDADHGTVCPLRAVDCPNECGECGLTAATLTEHLDRHCPYLCVPCPLACGHEGLRAKDVQEHVEQACPNRAVQCCNNCSQPLTAAILEFHLSHECALRCDPCRLGCGVQRLLAKDHDAHTEGRAQSPGPCPYSNKTCKFGCGIVQLFLKDVDSHLTDECPLRPVLCPNGCMNKTRTSNTRVKACNLSQHLAEECPLRILQCCWHPTHAVVAEDLEKHERSLCPFREAPCPAGCGTIIKVIEESRHLDQFCPKRRTNCRMFCGTTIPLDKMQAHERDECPMRAVHCPNGCDMFPHKIRAKDLEKHLRVCPHRETNAEEPSQCPSRLVLPAART